MMQELVQEHSTSFVIDNVEEEATMSGSIEGRTPDDGTDSIVDDEFTESLVVQVDHVELSASQGSVTHFTCHTIFVSSNTMDTGGVNELR